MSLCFIFVPLFGWECSWVEEEVWRSWTDGAQDDQSQ